MSHPIAPPPIVAEPPTTPPPQLPTVDLKYGMMGEYFVIQQTTHLVFDRDSARNLAAQINAKLDEAPRIEVPTAMPRIVIR